MPRDLPDRSDVGAKQTRQTVVLQTKCSLKVKATVTELYFNKDGSAIKKASGWCQQACRYELVTVGSKGCNVVLESKYGPPKIVNDGVTMTREVELEGPVENIGSKLMRQATSKTNDLASDGTTTSIVLAQGLIMEGVKEKPNLSSSFLGSVNIYACAPDPRVNQLLAEVSSGVHQCSGSYSKRVNLEKQNCIT